MAEINPCPGACDEVVVALENLMPLLGDAMAALPLKSIRVPTPLMEVLVWEEPRTEETRGRFFLGVNALPLATLLVLTGRMGAAIGFGWLGPLKRGIVSGVVLIGARTSRSGVDLLAKASGVRRSSQD